MAKSAEVYMIDGNKASKGEFEALKSRINLGGGFLENEVPVKDLSPDERKILGKGAKSAKSVRIAECQTGPGEGAPRGYVYTEYTAGMTKAFSIMNIHKCGLR